MGGSLKNKYHHLGAVIMSTVGENKEKKTRKSNQKKVERVGSLEMI